MSKIITFLTNDNKIIQQIDGIPPPPNSFAILTENYDILDMNGKVVLIEDFDQSNCTDLEVTAIPGIYHISIQSNKGLVNKKLVITE